jgi:predicted nucleotidyltransferase
MQYGSAVLKIFEVFNTNSVEYMVVGGTAVAYYGYDRPSTNLSGEIVAKPDFDFWYNPSYKNYFHLLDALEQLGKDVTEYREEKIPDTRNAFFKLSFDDYTLDLLPRIKAPLKFSVAFAKKKTLEQDGVKISFISFDDLIKDKEVNARPKDINDIEKLRSSLQ